VLPHHARLRRAVEFTDTTRRGARVGGPLMIVHMRPGDPSHPARAGFIVSRSVGSAVSRNQVRRRLRHLVRDRLPALAPGCNLVIRATPAAASVTSGTLGAALDRALERLKTSAGHA